MAYSGITGETLMLLAENKFNNSKIFYEDNKKKIKEGITVPLRQIAGELSELMYEIDPMMNLDPNKMVSRVRRDTRFSKNKNLYRDNLWVMFMRPKQQWEMYPCMWFEVAQDSFSYGAGTFRTSPRLMEIYRKHLIENETDFLKAVKAVKSNGFTFFGEGYKKPKGGDPSPAVLPYYNVKSMGFIKYRKDFATLNSDTIIDELKQEYKALSKMYKFLLDISDEHSAEYD